MLFQKRTNLPNVMGVEGARSDVLNPVFYHLPLEVGLTKPVVVLPTAVGKHLTRYAALGNPPDGGSPTSARRFGCGKYQAGNVKRVVA